MYKKSSDSDVSNSSKLVNSRYASRRLIDVDIKEDEKLVIKHSKSIQNNTVVKEIHSIEKQSWNSLSNNKTSDSEPLVFIRKKKSDHRVKFTTTIQTTKQSKQSKDCESKSYKKRYVRNRYKRTNDHYYMMTEEDVKDTFPVSHFKFPLPKTKEKNEQNYCCLDFDGTKWDRKNFVKINEGIQNVKIVNKSTSLSIRSHTCQNDKHKDDKMQIILSPKERKKGDSKRKKKCKIIVTSSTLNVEALKPSMKNQEQQTEISFTLLKNIMKCGDIQKIRRKDVEALFKKKIDKENFKKLVEHPTDLNILYNLIEMKNMQKQNLIENMKKKEDKKKANLSKVSFPIIEITSSATDNESENKPKKTLPRRRIGEQELVEIFENSKRKDEIVNTSIIEKPLRPQMPRKTILKKSDDDLKENENHLAPTPRTYKKDSVNNEEISSSLLNNSGTSLNDFTGSDLTLNSFNQDIYKWLLNTDFGKSLEHEIIWPNLGENSDNKSMNSIENIKLEISNLSERIIQEFLDSKFNENKELHQELLNLNKIIGQFKAKINNEEMLKEMENESINQDNSTTGEEPKNIRSENTYIINNCIHPEYPSILVTKEVNNNCFDYLNTMKRTFKDSFNNENVEITQINGENITLDQKQLIENISNTFKYNDTTYTISEAETEKLISNDISVDNPQPFELIPTQNTIINKFTEINPSIQRSNTFPNLPNGTVYKTITLTKSSKLPILKKHHKIGSKSVGTNSIVAGPEKGRIIPGSIHNSTFLFTKVNKDQNKESSFKKRKEYYQKIKQVHDTQKQKVMYRPRNTENKWKRKPEFCVNVCFANYSNYFRNTKCTRFKNNNEHKWWNDLKSFRNHEYGAVSTVSLESGIGSLHASTIVSNQPFQLEDFDNKETPAGFNDEEKTENNSTVDEKKENDGEEGRKTPDECSLVSRTETSLYENTSKEDIGNNNTDIIENIETECIPSDTKSNTDIYNSDSDSVINIEKSNSDTQSICDLKNNDNNEPKVEQNSSTESFRGHEKDISECNKDGNEFKEISLQDSDKYYEFENNEVDQSNEIVSTQQNDYNQSFDIPSHLSKSSGNCSKTGLSLNKSIQAFCKSEITTQHVMLQTNSPYDNLKPKCFRRNANNLSQRYKNFIIQSLNDYKAITLQCNHKYGMCSKNNLSRKKKTCQTVHSPEVIKTQCKHNTSKIQQNNKHQEIPTDVKIKNSTEIKIVQENDIKSLTTETSVQTNEKIKKQKLSSKKNRMWYNISKLFSKTNSKKRKN